MGSAGQKGPARRQNEPQSADADEDTTLFRQAMRDVRRLGQSARVPPPRRTAPARARFTRADRAEVLRESLAPGVDLYESQPGDELSYRRPGVPETVLRQLRRGHYRVDAEGDLHGLTAGQAAAALAELLREARTRGWRCIRIIHGKGLRSGQRGPVLKNTVNVLLRQSDAVLAFCSARPAAGGTGATLALLR